MQAFLNFKTAFTLMMRQSFKQYWWAYALLILACYWIFAPAGTLLRAIDYVVNNLPEVIGTSTSIAGAMLLAMKSKHSALGWPLWIISTLAWVYYALQLPNPGLGLIAQNVVFTVINLFGTWRWLVKPYLNER
jgi:hypothetical protein